jgi:myo-inositol-1(or 4)-monophosphatase
MLSPELKTLNEAIKSAGSIIMRYFGQLLSVDSKSTNADYRTKADVEAEQAIIDAIEKIFPTYNIIAEEHGEKQKGSPYTFVIDPLDGTNNFVLGVPAFTSSVALMENGKSIYGVIYNPITGNTYYALKDQGAFLNGNRIAVNQEHRENNSTVSYFCNYVTPRQRIVDFNTKLFTLPVKRCLDLWSPTFSYCALACGKIEAIINDGIELYDFAAGKLIAMEAGAKVTDFSGNNIDTDENMTFLITNGSSLHSTLVDHVTAHFER